MSQSQDHLVPSRFPPSHDNEPKYDASATDFLEVRPRRRQTRWKVIGCVAAVVIVVVAVGGGVAAWAYKKHKNETESS
jgi:hypothetical protein